MPARRFTGNIAAAALAALLAAGCGSGKPAPREPVAPETIAWGPAVGGLQVGLETSRNAFVAGEPLSFKAHLRNVGDAAKDASGLLFDDIVFESRAGGVSRRARWTGPSAPPPLPPPPPLDAGRALEFDVVLGGEFWRFEAASPAPRDAPAAPIRSLGPGRYSVRAGSKAGRIISGPVEIEILPKAGAPAKPAIAWGPATDGLQAGLVALGSRDGVQDWDLDYMTCPECTRAPGAIRKKKTCPECGRNEVLAPRERLCRECACRLRCCSGCRRPFVPGNVFLDGEPIVLETRLRNVSPGDISIYGDFTEAGRWNMVFEPVGGAAPLKAVPPLIRADYVDVKVPAGGEYAAHLQLFLKYEAWSFQDAREPAAGGEKTEPRKTLPPGKYRVTLSYPWARKKADGEWTESLLRAGPVEIEVRPKAAAADD